VLYPLHYRVPQRNESLHNFYSFPNIKLLGKYSTEMSWTAAEEMKKAFKILNGKAGEMI
jgi:hypothetical protein